MLDLCATPLRLNEWYAARHGLAVRAVCSDILAFAQASPFDMICTHSFLGRFAPEVRPKLVARWHELPDFHERMAPWKEQVVWSGALGYGHVRLWLGVAAATRAAYDEADEHFGFASRFHDEHGLELWSARTQLGWAESLAARGDRAGAQERAAHALALARANGYGLIEEHARLLSTVVTMENGSR